MRLSPEEFVRRVMDSGLVAPAAVRVTVETVRAGATLSTTALADEFVRQGALTAWQACRLRDDDPQPLAIGNYVLLEPLGRGGMGTVFKAEHRRMKRTVALKLLPADALAEPAALDLFQREIEAAARLEHPNIVAAYDADEADGARFLVMQFVEGIDLAALVDAVGPLPAADALCCVLQAARGLAHAHAQGIVHCDIKPGNLIAGFDGIVRILDLGLARFTARRDAAVGNDAPDQVGGFDRAPALHAVMATVDFTAPERISLSTDADLRSDVYSLGCTLHYLLTGRPVYGGETLAQRIEAHRERPIPSLRELREEVSARLDAVFRTMVAKRPEERIASGEDLIAALQECGIDVPASPACLADERVRAARPAGSRRGSGHCSPMAERSTSDLEPRDPAETLAWPATATEPVPARWPWTRRAALGGLVTAGLLIGWPVANQLLDWGRETGPGNREAGAPGPEAARWVLSIGGTLQIDAGDYWQTLNPGDDMPLGELAIVSIQLGGNRLVGDGDLERLAELESLQMLWLGGTSVGDAGLRHLEGLERLRFLSLSSTRVTDAGLESLAVLTGLEILRLDRTAVTDVGLPHLHGLTRLNELALENTRVSEAGIAPLRQALPRCRVVW